MSHDNFDALMDGIQAATHEQGDRAVLRVRLDGRTIGHVRMTSVVDERCGEPSDALKVYGLRFFLPVSHMLAARRLETGSGVLRGAEVDTPGGTVSFDSPPGLKAPSRRRGRR